MERKLASVQKIVNIEPITNADKIEIATILGWEVVVKKGQFKPGEMCVYCEIDSILPEKPEFEFLRDTKFRVKTRKFRKQISQGIAFSFTDLQSYNIPLQHLDEGADVTELLGVIKYDAEEAAMVASGGKFKLGSSRRNFPSYVPKTDETRVQTIPHILDEIKGLPLYITTKIDGTSATFAKYGRDIDVCSRNISMKDPNYVVPWYLMIVYKILIAIGFRGYIKYTRSNDSSIYWEVYRKYGIDKLFDKVDGIAIQGEIAGPSIQKNRLGLTENKFFCFNVYDIVNKRYYSFSEFNKFCMENGIPTVPILYIDLVLPEDITIAKLLDMAKGKYEGTTNNREGIVIRPMVETKSKALGGRLSFKVINNQYLLKEEE